MYVLVLCIYEQQMAKVWYFTVCLVLILPAICNLNNSQIEVALHDL